MSEQQWLDIFADNLRDKLIEYGANQREFAEDIGVAESTVSRYIRGQAVPSIFILINMSHVLGCSIDELADFGQKIRY
jgi:transcriptional regulator with XRE-family HTH domain